MATATFRAIIASLASRQMARRRTIISGRCFLQLKSGDSSQPVSCLTWTAGEVELSAKLSGSILRLKEDGMIKVFKVAVPDCYLE